MKSKKLPVLFFAVFSLLSVNNLFAQFSTGLELGVPMGDFSGIATVGIGISGRYEATINGNLNWTAYAGYLSFGGVSYLIGTYPSTSIVPLAGGIKYYFDQKSSGPYAGCDISLNFVSYSIASINQNSSGADFSPESVSKLGFSPGLGYRHSHWDFNFKYNSVGDFTYFGLRVAYIFGTKQP